MIDLLGNWRRCAARLLLILVASAMGGAAAVKAAEPPVIPVGLDAYRMWDHWADQRIGCRAYMRSTYDRRGMNESADSGHYLFQLADDNNVALDVEGKGVLYFVRTNHWHGSPWRYSVDGVEHIVKESSTADPDHPVKNSTFIPADLFPEPLAWTWSVTKGADLNWVPMPFERLLRLAYSRTHYGTGYFIWHQFDPAAKLSQPIQTWDGKTPPAEDVLKLIAKAGSSLVPEQSSPEFKQWKLTEQRGQVETTLPVEIATIEGPAMLRALRFSAPADSAAKLSRLSLRITWDERSAASVDAPLPLFFGAGTFYNRDGREYLVKAVHWNVRTHDGRIEMACYFPMPFFKSARIELIGNQDDSVSDMDWAVSWQPYAEPADHVGYFHATYADHPQPEFGKDLVVLDTRKTETGGDWSGQFVGMSWIFSHDAVLSTLEGDPRFFFDDSQTPQCYGTGTEEWGGGGDYWGGQNMTLPFAGHPCGARKAKEAKCEEDKIESAYRFLLADMMPFGRNAVIRLEHGAVNKSVEHYETVAYWYGQPTATLVPTDELKIADLDSEKQHKYVSPDASKPVEITSRYEWGPDTLDGKEIYPPHNDRGRFTKGTSEFTLKLRPDNLGVLLRRTLDYAFPNQRAEVYVADASKPDGSWRKAGIWYLAGSNTCVYSAPKGELGATQHRVETSNRRFRDDEFIISRELTAGLSAIRVRVVFTPVKRPLFPGHPLPELAWSELKYTAYCWVLP